MRGRMRGRRVLAPACTPRSTTPQLYSASLLFLALNREKSRKVFGGAREGTSRGRGLPGAEGVAQPRARAPPARAASPSFSSRTRSRFPGSAARPRAGALEAEAARAATRGRQRRAGGAGRGGGGVLVGRARAGAGLLRKQPREGILGAGSAPSRARGAGPRAARVTRRPRPAPASPPRGFHA